MVSTGFGTILHVVAGRAVISLVMLPSGMDCDTPLGPYLIHSEFPLRQLSHISHSLVVYLTQQPIDLCLDHRAFKTTLQNEVLEELDETL